MNLTVSQDTTQPVIETDTDARVTAIRGLEREVAILIRRVRRIAGERARAIDDDLPPSSYLMLTWLVQEGPVRASVMVDCFHVDKAAISRQVQHLVKLGLVVRTPDPEDGRATLVAASEEARRRLREATTHHRRWFDERLGDWSNRDLGDLLSVLTRYNQSLEDPPHGSATVATAPE